MLYNALINVEIHWKLEEWFWKNCKKNYLHHKSNCQYGQQTVWQLCQTDMDNWENLIFSTRLSLDIRGADEGAFILWEKTSIGLRLLSPSNDKPLYRASFK